MTRSSRQWMRGGAPKPLARVLSSILQPHAPSSAAGSRSNDLAEAVVRQGATYLRKLRRLPPYAATELLFQDIGFCDLAPNERKRWARTMTNRCGTIGPVLAWWLVHWIMSSGPVSCCAVLRHRLPRLLRGELGGAPPGSEPYWPA